MQTLYDIRITDRVTVHPVASALPGHGFEARFDGEFIGRFPSGRAAVNGAKDWLKARTAAREAEQAAAAAREETLQYADDERFLDALAEVLDVERSAIDRLLEIVKRRA